MIGNQKECVVPSSLNDTTSWMKSQEGTKITSSSPRQEAANRSCLLIEYHVIISRGLGKEQTSPNLAVCVHEVVGRPFPFRARRSRRRRVGRTRTSEPSPPPPTERLHIPAVTSAVTSADDLPRDLRPAGGVSRFACDGPKPQAMARLLWSVY